MRLAPKRREEPTPAQELVEVVTPRTNTATLTAAENLLAAISLAEPFSLEIAATAQARWFLARSASDAMRSHLTAQLGAAYPQAEIRPLDLARYPSLDPALKRADEQVALCTLVLRAPPYLPLRTFRDLDLADRASQADPVLGLLGALTDLPDGWRSLAQLVLRPAPDTWCDGYLRLAVEHPLAAERATGRADTSLSSVFLLAGLLLAATLGFQGYQWYLARDWFHLSGLIGGLAPAVPCLFWLIRRLGRRQVYDMRLVQEKVSRIAYVTELRLAVFAPLDVAPVDLAVRLARLTTAYRQFNLAVGNGLLPRPCDVRDRDVRALAPLSPTRTLPSLNTRELAGLWHLPQAQADVPLVERTTARRWLPLPSTVSRGCRIGVSTHQGHTVPVALPDDLLRRHLLLVAKTRRGKSSLLLQLARYLMTAPTPSMERPALVLVDPHHDLAQAALGLVPQDRRHAVVYLDAGQLARPFGLNLLDTGLGWDRDKAVANTLSIFRREFDRFWGPRMEDAFRFALLTLFEANQAICQADPAGRSRQHTLLAVPALLNQSPFRGTVLSLVTDPVVKAWWTGYFDQLDRRLQTEIINPVQTKVQRFAGSLAARLVVGQPRSTVNPAAWLQRGSIVIVNTAKGRVGEDTAALIGGTLLNLVALAVGEQANLAEGRRRPVTLIVDEFHTMPGADYEAILAELAKYGANLVLATQSLTRLEALDREQGRSLRAMVFANLDGLFAFHTSAEDARYLAPELGGAVDVQDLVELGDYQCYARLSVGGERLPAFSVRLDPPPASDLALQATLAAASAQQYGRERSLVEAEIQAAMTRVDLAREAEREAHQTGKDGPVVNRGAEPRREAQVQPEAEPVKGRSEHRKAKPKPHEASRVQPVAEARPLDESGEAVTGDWEAE